MGCVHSKHSGDSKKKTSDSNGNLTNGNGPTVSDPVRWNDNNIVIGNNSDNNNNNNHSSAKRIFDVEVCNADKDDPPIYGKLEITDNSLLYRLKGRSPLVWPLRFLRSYGNDKNIFSFECGRRCPTGPGVYVFKCSKAEQLFKTLSDVINNATNINSSNIAINNHLQNTSHSSANNVHEYQNLSLFESDHSNFGTLPSRIPQAFETINRPHSSMSTEQANHTYLNSVGQNVIGVKSQPNYYISNPLSCQNSQSEGSKTSLNGSFVGLSSTLSNSYDSCTLPQMKNVQHEYVNSNVCINTFLDDSLMDRRKSSEQHLYENHEIPVANSSRLKKLESINSKIAASDDLSTFCYVNLDIDSRNERKNILTSNKNKSARTTPEPSSYIQLDLNSEKAKERKNNQTKRTLESKNQKTEAVKTNEVVNEKVVIAKTGETSNGKMAKNNNKENLNKSDNNAQDIAKTNNTTVSYAQIDFARTWALTNSAANHRKL